MLFIRRSVAISLPVWEHTGIAMKFAVVIV